MSEIELIRGLVAARGISGDQANAVGAAAAELVNRARAERPLDGLDDAAFIAHLFALTEWESASDLAQMHAGDLRLAFASARGDDAAIRAIEREHLSRVRTFVAAIDASPAFVSELTQELRHRLFIGDGDRPARITTYSGRGPLGGWIA